MQVLETKPDPLGSSRQASAYRKVNLLSHPTAEPRGLEQNSGGVWRGKWQVKKVQGIQKLLLLCSFSEKKAS